MVDYAYTWVTIGGIRRPSPPPPDGMVCTWYPGQDWIRLKGGGCDWVWARLAAEAHRHNDGVASGTVMVLDSDGCVYDVESNDDDQGGVSPGSE